jgi:hypothetical protein
MTPKMKPVIGVSLNDSIFAATGDKIKQMLGCPKQPERGRAAACL